MSAPHAIRPGAIQALAIQALAIRGGLDFSAARSHGRSYIGQRCELLGTRRRGRIAALLFVNDAGYARGVVVAWDADAQGPDAQGGAAPPNTHLVAELRREP